tara:strand:- start:25366 stop:26205 length:840 start_codon:yes stop_codon:yes gene_type:complete
MAKELPYFQFEPAEYLTGDISFCSLSAQGLFTILCSYYWQRSCNITKEQFLRRINNPKEFQELVDENVIQLQDSSIKIKFLDEQFDKVTKQSKTNSANGSKGGRPRKKKQKETETKPKLNPNESETKGIREDKIREEEIKEDEVDEIITSDVLYDLEKLKTEYLQNEKLVKAFVYNKANKIKDAKELEGRLSEFIISLTEQGRHKETFKEFSSYFRNWNKKLPSDTQVKRIENPNGEKIITFVSNGNPMKQQMTESNFIKYKANMEGGGYKFKIINNGD